MIKCLQCGGDLALCAKPIGCGWLTVAATWNNEFCVLANGAQSSDEKYPYNMFEKLSERMRVEITTATRLACEKHRGLIHTML